MVLSKVEVDLDKPVKEITEDEQRIINAYRSLYCGKVVIVKYKDVLRYIKPTYNFKFVKGHIDG